MDDEYGSALQLSVPTGSRNSGDATRKASRLTIRDFGLTPVATGSINAPKAQERKGPRGTMRSWVGGVWVLHLHFSMAFRNGIIQDPRHFFCLLSGFTP